MESIDIMKILVLSVLFIAIIFLFVPVSGTTFTAIPQGGSFYYGQKNVDVTSAIPNGTVAICWWDSTGIRGTPHFQDCANVGSKTGNTWTSDGLLSTLLPGGYYALPSTDSCVNPSTGYVICVPGNVQNPSIYTLIFTVIVPPPPVSTFKANSTSGPAPLTVLFDGTSSNNPVNWYWQFGDGSVSHLQNPIHTYSISGVFSVTLQATNNYPYTQATSTTSTITVLSPLAPTTSTTSQTLIPNQTSMITTLTTFPTTSVTAQTTLPAATLTQRETATPTGYNYTPRPSVTTVKVYTSIPTNTPTQKSPIGLEIGIIAIIGAAFFVQKQK